ncbi:MAG: PD40 domain-containing protein [Alphaproteobacteria bacterium]|nr:PD40 domain-containing protein [Alphaproteobacteria bacterium]
MIALLLPLALATPVHTGAGHASAPRLAPDGTHLAFELQPAGAPRQVYTVRIGRGEPEEPVHMRLPGETAAFAYDARGPAWHPSGFVLFHAFTGGTEPTLYFAKPGGAAPVALLDAGQTGTWAAASGPARLVFLQGPPGREDLAVRDTKSGRVERFRTDLAEASPAVHADETHVAFARIREGQSDLLVRDLETREEQAVAFGPEAQVRPAFAGDAILYFEGQGDTWSLAKVGLDGKGHAVLAEGVMLPQSVGPGVSPDGTLVAWVRADRRGSVFVHDLASGETAEIETGLDGCAEPTIVRLPPDSPPTLGQPAQRVLLAFTAAGTTWRTLHVVEIGLDR